MGGGENTAHTALKCLSAEEAGAWGRCPRGTRDARRARQVLLLLLWLGESRRGHGHAGEDQGECPCHPLGAHPTSPVHNAPVGGWEGRSAALASPSSI